MRRIARFFGFLFATGAILFFIGAGVAGLVIWHFEQNLPGTAQLKNYEPPVMTRVHAGDGSVLAEYSHQRRLYLPSSAIPPLVKNAFISAEDKNFYTDHGIDPEGIVRALLVLLEGSKHIQGASTITQQVAKNFLLNNERTLTRKIREALLSFKIEASYSKSKILELYLNEIYLGLGNYGIAAAALDYYDESVYQLTVAQAAYLAGLPKGPNNYNPFHDTDAAIARRNYVIDRMVANGYISKAAGDKAEAEPLGVKPRIVSADTYEAGYFAEEVRRELLERYGEKVLYEGGLSVRTTIDPQMQLWARKAFVDGLVRFDEAHGYRGPIRRIDIGNDWGVALAAVPALGDIAPWRLAVVLDAARDSATIGLQPPHDEAGVVSAVRVTGTLPMAGMRWTRKQSVSAVLRPGDVIYVEPMKGQSGQYQLRQIPKLSGAMVAMDPHTGRVFAMVGGFSFDQSEFNRATQALRQPGSSFKPFVYAAALANGYTPSSILLNDPVAIDEGNGQIWRPANFEKNAHGGPHTLRYAIEHSMNLMTVRLARDIGMPLIAEYAKRFGIYDDMPPLLAMSLGAGETTVLKMVTGYSMLDNGGKKITPTLIDSIQDRWGHTIYRHDKRICEGCNAPKWENQKVPKLIDDAKQVIDPLTAYQITHIMEGVIQRGTGVAIKVLGRHLAGKTGTTNQAKDLWFVGYSPDLAVGVYLGYDKPRSLGSGRNAQAATWAAPIFRDFMKMALKGKPDVPFRIPPGIKLISVNLKTGQRATGPGTILEAFKPGTAPPDGFPGGGASASSAPASPLDAERAVGSGTGGLY